MANHTPKLELHVGDDYACIMRAGETTDAAFITVKYPSLQDIALLRQMSEAPALFAALSDIYNKSHPTAKFYNGPAVEYRVPKELIDATRTVIAAAEGRAP